MELFYFWITLVIVFIIIEMVTATFYGLALSIASGIVALYVWYTGEPSLDIVQGVIFVVVTFLASFTLPKLLVSRGSVPPTSQGIDGYIGMKRKVKLQGEALKVTFDGVDYPIENDDDIQAGDQVEIVSTHSIGFLVKKVEE